MTGPGSRLLRVRALLVWFAVGCGPSAGVVGSGTSTSDGSSTGAHAAETSTTLVDSGGAEATSGIVGSSSTSSSSSSSGFADSTTGFVSHCEVPPETPPACWDVICEQFSCGCSGCLYDLDGCPRPRCDEQADCIAPMYCNANILVNTCPGGQAGWWSCEDNVGECICGGSLGCGPDPRAYCLDPAEFVQDDICIGAMWTCDELDYIVGDTQSALVEIAADMSEDLLAQARGCLWLRVQRLFDECGASPCDVLCEYLPSSIGCGPDDCSGCSDADPDEVIELLQALVDRSLACADCALCAELDNAACVALMGC